jgi:hypothetical protein
VSDCGSQYDRECKDEFASIQAKLDRLDEAIRGNGKPGIQLRLDRLESAKANRSRLMWIIAGSMVALALSTFWKLAFGG